jgi:hypothetical protein
MRSWLDNVPKLYRTLIGYGQRWLLKFVEGEFKIVKKPDTTRTSLLHNKRISERMLQQLIKQLRLIEKIEQDLRE